MPGLNMMRDMDVSDPWARDLEKSLGKPVERAIPMPDCLKRLEEKRIADERFEKMVDAVVEKPAAKPTLPQAAPMSPPWAKPKTMMDWYDEKCAEMRTMQEKRPRPSPYQQLVEALAKPYEEYCQDRLYANQFMNLWDAGESRKNMQETLDKAHWDSRTRVTQNYLVQAANAKPAVATFLEEDLRDQFNRAMGL